ncbi:DUF4412 domain-containing protein, partial [bacterium]
LCLALLASTAVAARADLSYTQTTTTSFGSMMPGAGNLKTKTWVKGNASRNETNVMGQQIIMLTKAGSSITQIDPASKTYVVNSVGAGGRTRPGGMRPPGAPSDVTVTVKKLGVEKVRGINAPHWRLEMLMKMKTKQGTRNMNMTTEIWSSTTPYPNVGKGSGLDKLPENVRGMFGSGMKIKGDVKNMGAAYATVPLRMKMFMNGNSFGTTDTTNISTKTLPASLFTVPAGYRKVTQTQWDTRQRETMMKKMQGMMKGMPGMGGMPRAKR